MGKKEKILSITGIAILITAMSPFAIAIMEQESYGEISEITEIKNDLEEHQNSNIHFTEKEKQRIYNTENMVYQICQVLFKDEKLNCFLNSP